MPPDAILYTQTREDMLYFLYVQLIDQCVSNGVKC